MGVYGPHTQVKRLSKALIFLTCKRNIILYSEMRFQLYQSHHLSAIGSAVATFVTSDTIVY